MKLSSITIKKLYGRYDVNVDIEKGGVIYIAENGRGKSTVLRMVYFIFVGNYTQLMKEQFDDIELKDSLGEVFVISNPFSKLKSDNIDIENIDLIIDYLRREDYGAMFLGRAQYLPPKASARRDMLEEMKQFMHYELRGLYDLSWDKAEKFIESYAKHFIKDGSTERMYLEFGFNRGMEKELVRFTGIGQERVLYLPTYRRIELDLKEQGWEIKPIEKSDSYNQSIAEGRFVTDMVQFGMQDVSDRLSELVEQIKSIALKSFQTMASNLLTEYARKEVSVRSQTPSVYESNEIEIILNRIGDYIPSTTKGHIVSLVADPKTDRSEYRTLYDIIDNLVKGYQLQKVLDEKIKGFVDVSNSYLNGKRIIFDEGNLSVSIVMDGSNGGRTIDFSDLSSGEKQIVSLFAKIYLNNDDNLIIIIDEPELSLSNEWQKKLLPDIYNSKRCSFLMVATHSPYIVHEDELKKLAQALY